jgi:hypothetical protein
MDMRAAAFETLLPGGPITCLPLSMVQTASRVSPVVMLALALPAAIAALTPFALIAMHAARDHSMLVERPETAVMLSAALVVWAALFGWPITIRALRFGHRRQIEIDGNHVTVVEGSWAFRRSWTENVTKYEGVAHHVRSSLSGTRHELILIHPDPAKSLLLRVADKITQTEIDQATLLLGCREIAPQPFYRRRVQRSRVRAAFSRSHQASAH